MTLPVTPNPSRSLLHPRPSAMNSMNGGDGPIHVITPTERDNVPLIKSIVLDILGVFFALVLGFCYSRYLAGGFSLWFSLAVFLPFAAVASLQVFLQPDSGRRAIGVLAETVAFSIWFAAHGLGVMAVAAAGLFFLLLLGYFESRSELTYATEVRFFRATRSVMGKAVTAVALAAVLLYLPQAESTGHWFFSQNKFQLAYDWFAGTFGNFYPGIALNGTLGDIAQNIVGRQLQADPAYQKLKPADQASTTQAAVIQFVGNFSSQFGMTEETSTPISSALYDGISRVLQSFRDRLQGWFLAVWVLVVFLILRVFGVVLGWLAQVFAMILYEILLASGFMKIVQHPDVKEVVEY